jgi:DNA-binding response OmpR family regulator
MERQTPTGRTAIMTAQTGVDGSRRVLISAPRDLADRLERGLTDHGWSAVVLSDGAELEEAAQSWGCRAVVVSAELLGALSARTHGERVGVLVVTPRGDATARIEALTHGADACQEEPVAIDELCARLRAVVRRLEP